jgi:M3 family oligoendopeptidase
MYEEMSPETGEFFNFMKDHELYDFVTRENKHLGGYMTFLPDYGAPFIFSNFNGTSADIDVLTHEAGHAFEGYYASRNLPIQQMISSTSEINEIHSMAMEFFAYPYMERFFGDKTGKYIYAHFTEAIKNIPYLVSVDEFQHRVFENPDLTPAKWRKAWNEIEKKYMPWRSYDGNQFLEEGGFWMQKQHIFLYPFYYIEYAMAQLDAFSLYRKQIAGADAWESYLKLCAMGGKYGYFETLERAGLPNPLDPENVKDIADFVEEHSKLLKQQI